MPFQPFFSAGLTTPGGAFGLAQTTGGVNPLGSAGAAGGGFSAAGVMAGAGAASAIAGGFAEAAKRRRQQAAFDQQEFQRRFNNLVQNIGITRANAAKRITNQRLEVASFTAAERDKSNLRFSANVASMQLSQDMARTSAALHNQRSQTTIGRATGSSAALLRQTAMNITRAQSLLRYNEANALEDIGIKRKNILNQRDQSIQEQVAFIPGVSGVGKPGAAVAQGFLKAAIGLGSFGLGGG